MTTRWLRNESTGQIVEVTHDPHHVGNGHVLRNPTDPMSEAAEGWVEVTRAEFVEALARVEREREAQQMRDVQAAAAASAKLAALGFSVDERRVLGLP